MSDITAIGELLIDFTPSGKNERGVQLFAENPGGAPANVLAIVAHLGGKDRLHRQGWPGCLWGLSAWCPDPERY